MTDRYLRLRMVERISEDLPQHVKVSAFLPVSGSPSTKKNSDEISHQQHLTFLMLTGTQTALDMIARS